MSGTQYLEFGSATSDHRYILTSNAQPNLQSWPPSVDNCILTAGTPLDVLLARHRERVSDLEQREPGTVLQTFADMEAVFAAMKRYRQELSVYRKSIGYITLEEMLALARNPAEEQAARRLWAEIRRQRQEES